MHLRTLLAVATSALTIAAPAAAGTIQPVVNASTELANDLRGLTFAADGKIYASGHAGTVNEETRTVVARFNVDGTPDTAFGEDGIIELDLAEGRQEASLGVAELQGGDVVVMVNAVDEDGGQSVYLLRFDSSGAQKVAPEWGDEAGKVEVVLGWANGDNAGFTGTTPPTDTGWDLLVDRTGGDERLVVFALGSAAEGSGRTDNDRYVVRLNAADGAPDASFNSGQPVSFHSAAALADNARRGIVEEDGSILSAGYTNLGEGLGNHVVLMRLKADGTLDSGFGNFIYPESSGTAVGLKAQPGVAVFNPFVVDGGFAECYGAAKLADGSYVTTGYGRATAEGRESTLGYQMSVAQDMVTFRVTPTGLDMSWGNEGTQAIQSEGRGRPTTEDRGRHILALPDGRVLEVGRYGGNAAAFVLTPEGQLDTAQDGDGVIELAHPTINSQFFNAVLSPDGTRVALTTNANEHGARLVVLELQD